MVLELRTNDRRSRNRCAKTKIRVDPLADQKERDEKGVAEVKPDSLTPPQPLTLSHVLTKINKEINPKSE